MSSSKPIRAIMLMNDCYLKSVSRPANLLKNPSGISGAVKLHHPERLGSGRLLIFQELVRADHTLSNPERRREYDRALSETELTAMLRRRRC